MERKIRKIPVFIFLGCFLVTMLSIVPTASAWFFNDNVKVMTRNLYLGADIFKVVEAAQTNPDSIPYVVAEVYQTMLYTNFWERAEAIANEIELYKPQVIGLQEVSTFYIQTPGDILFGNPIQAETVVIDFYTVLEAALKARGMYYNAFSVTNADVELPMVDPESPTYLSDVRMVDHDYVLVRKGLAASEVLTGNYQTKLEMDLGGNPVAFDRGFVIVDVDVWCESYRFVSTHLEVRSGPESVFRVVQAAQMQELLGTIDYLAGLLGPKPVVMVGDFNSSSTDVPGEGLHPVYGWLPYVPPYMQAVAAGYLDAWDLIFFPRDGFTSGFSETIDDPYDELTSRIDLVFVGNKDVKWVMGTVTGDRMFNMTPSGLWPSDHGGVFTWIIFDR